MILTFLKHWKSFICRIGKKNKEVIGFLSQLAEKKCSVWHLHELINKQITLSLVNTSNQLCNLKRKTMQKGEIENKMEEVKTKWRKWKQNGGSENKKKLKKKKKVLFSLSWATKYDIEMVWCSFPEEYWHSLMAKKRKTKQRNNQLVM